VRQLARIIHKLGAGMVKKYIERYLSIYIRKKFCLYMNYCEYLKIHRIQDVFEPWLAPNKIYE